MKTFTITVTKVTNKIRSSITTKDIKEDAEEEGIIIGNIIIMIIIKEVVEEEEIIAIIITKDIPKIITCKVTRRRCFNVTMHRLSCRLVVLWQQSLKSRMLVIIKKISNFIRKIYGVS